MTPDDAPVLSQLQGEVWAKCAKGAKKEPDSAVGWIPVWRHLDDTGMVAGALWDLWLAESVKTLIGGALGGDAAGRASVVWLAASHDVGKVSPSFSTLVPELSVRAVAAGLSLNGIGAQRGPGHFETRHEIVSFLAMRDWLTARHGASRLQALPFASVLGAHHGLPPEYHLVEQAEKRPAFTGALGGWAGLRHELIDRAAHWSGAAEHLPDWLRDDIPQHVLVLLSGIVIMADWIASDDTLFPYETHTSASDRLHAAWASLDLPDRWVARAPVQIPADLFGERFEKLHGATLRPAQTDMANLAHGLMGPAMIILEAPMGEGKTEAALVGAEILAARNGLSGVLVALPTMATSDGMFGRVLPWAGKAGVSQDRLSVYLAHSKSGLNGHDEFLRNRSAGSIADDEEYPSGLGHIPSNLVAHDWLRSGRKRGMLSSLVVGTIDQLLFVALKSKHLNLRHLGLAQKAVIIDEAHAYDVFMSTFLDRALHWLGAYGVPVIVLSATLPETRRIEMLAAYESGQRGEEHHRKNARRTRYAGLRGATCYPLLSYTSTDGPPRQLTPAASGRTSTLGLDRIGDTAKDIGDYLESALDGGGCAAVIHNTVGRVQATAAYLRRRFPGADVTVAHSRFLAADRARIDRDLLTRFGDAPENRHRRPVASIVVASQVIEQSLDVDFDVMVSDLAPVDLLLQRAGRLHRHDREPSDRPVKVRSPRLALTGAKWSEAPAEPARASTFVYAPHLLYRTAAVLDGVTSLSLPSDITPLVQTVYGPGQVGPAAWQKTLARAEADFTRQVIAKESAAGAFLLESIPFDDDATLSTWSMTGSGEADDSPIGQAKVRDTDPSLEVVALFKDRSGKLFTPAWFIGGRTTPNEPVTATTRGLDNILGDCSIRLPAAVCKGDPEALACALAAARQAPWWGSTSETRYLHLLEFTLINGVWTAECGAWSFTYDVNKGLEHSKK